MMNHPVLAPALLSALLFSAAPVLAAPPKLHFAAAEQEIKAEHASKAELEAFSQVKVALAAAIAAANKHTSGGAVVDASFDAGDGKPTYKVKTYQKALCGRASSMQPRAKSLASAKRRRRVSLTKRIKPN